MILEDRFTIYRRYDHVQGVDLTSIYDNLKQCEVTQEEAERIISTEYPTQAKKLKEKAVETKYKVLDCVPYQTCPICSGQGKISTPLSSSTFEICTVCNGEKIIPMHIVQEINMEAPKPNIIFGVDYGTGNSTGIEFAMNADCQIIVPNPNKKE